MEKNMNPESIDRQMARLNPEDGWRPDTERALAQFHDLRDKGSHRARGGTPSWIWATAAAMVICGCLLAFPRLWKSGESAAAMRVLKDGQPTPDFNLKDSTGADLRLSDYKGKAVLLNFWATWCGGCKVEVPMLKEFETRYKANGLAVIGVSLDDDGWKSVMPYIEKNKLNYPVAIGNQQLAKRYGVDALTMTLLIDREGMVAGMHFGLVEKSTWESEIDRLLRK
jgi:peroxiredoxin